MKTKKRKDCFLGLHYDIHATYSPGQEVKPMGETTTEEMVQGIIDAVRPDFIQIDCKGHPGISSYPTKVGNAYPNIVGDPLRIWRDVTAKNGVALFMHYSGVVDKKAATTHPKWALRKADGGFDKLGVTSTFGSYAKELMIPQFLELAGEYKVDGVWVDGECWGTKADFSELALTAYKEETGVDLSDSLPSEKDHPHYQCYREFCREQFRKYLADYVDTVHEKYPDFQVASNWAYSTHMPEKVTTNVDFISGDFAPANAYNTARFDARGLAPQGKPWDLMAWGFYWKSVGRNENGGPYPAASTKHPVQLMQEGAAALSMGGGFQIYLRQNKNGGVNLNMTSSFKETMDFLRERKPYCFRGKPVPQAVILNSTTDRYLGSESLFNLDGYDSIKGLVNVMCDIQQSVELRSEHNLTGKMSDWPMIIVPKLLCNIEESFKKELLEYAKNGGNLVLNGMKTLEVFKELSCKLHGMSAEEVHMPVYISPDKTRWSGIEPDSGYLEIKEGGEVLAWTSLDHNGKYEESDTLPFAVKTAYGKGNIVTVAGDMGGIYKNSKTHTARSIMRNIADSLYEPMVKIEGSRYVDVVALEKDSKLMLQLTNTLGEHELSACWGFDEIPPIGPITVSVKLQECPKKVTRQPQGKVLSGEYKNGSYTTVLDRLEIYDILVFE